MVISKHFSQEISVFHGRIPPVNGIIAGYGAVINAYNLKMPLPEQLAIISKTHRKFEEEEWQVFTPRYKPADTLYAHLVFALKYEGINLLLFKKLFEILDPSEIESWIQNEPQSQYTRRIWFLYEWLMQSELSLPDMKTGSYIFLIDGKQQYCSPKSINSSRHRVKNNLPGNKDFCPLIKKTAKLESYISGELNQKTENILGKLSKDILLRTSAFLLLKDSKASFNIEGELPPQNRALRWGRTIGQAGLKPLTKHELIRLQQIVIEDSRFVKMGYRNEGGFVGEHDRFTYEPIPDHISAKWQDIEELMNGLLNTADIMSSSGFHPVLTAAAIAFGFVFIHPFADGNGRLHRYLIHHLLAITRFTPQSIVFPVSAAILDRLDDYRKVLESYSHPLLDFIQWEKTPDNNVNVLNDTIDFYRYFDATKQAEFLFESVEYTVNKIIPDEVKYLQLYDEMKNWLEEIFHMPDKMVSLLIRFLEQNNGSLSKRATDKEFAGLTDEEVALIEEKFRDAARK